MPPKLDWRKAVGYDFAVEPVIGIESVEEFIGRGNLLAETTQTQVKVGDLSFRSSPDRVRLPLLSNGGQLSAAQTSRSGSPFWDRGHRYSDHLRG